MRQKGIQVKSAPFTNTNTHTVMQCVFQRLPEAVVKHSGSGMKSGEGRSERKRDVAESTPPPAPNCLFVGSCEDLRGDPEGREREREVSVSRQLGTTAI